MKSNADGRVALRIIGNFVLQTAARGDDGTPHSIFSGGQSLKGTDREGPEMIPGPPFSPMDMIPML